MVEPDGLVKYNTASLSAIPPVAQCKENFIGPAAPIRFASFELDPSSRELRRKGRVVPLQDLPFRLLTALLERPGEVLTREELKSRLWSNGIYGEFDPGINTAVKKLRQALDDSADNPRFIETLPRVGYRFLVPVSRSEIISSPNPVPNPTQPAELVFRPRRSSRWSWIILLTAIGAAVLLLSFHSPELIQKSRSVPQRVLPLTSYPGTESEPTFSPGGSQVAFAWDGGSPGASDIYVKVVGENKPLRLTSSPARDSSPSWSPDGRWIAFVRVEEQGRPGAVYLISPLGGQEQKVAEQANRVSWTHDSKSLLLITPTNSGNNAAIETLQLDTRQRRRLTNPIDPLTLDRSAAAAPDGRTLAFVRCKKLDECDIFLTPPSGDNPVRLTNDNVPILGLTWAADSREIIFASARLGERKLWRVRVSGSDPKLTQAAPSEKAAAFPVLSTAAPGVPARLAFQQATGYTNIRRTELIQGVSGSAGEVGGYTAFLPSTWGEMEPAYSPDGSMVAFGSKRSGEWQTWVAQSNGENSRPIAGLMGDLAWSPDGRMLASNCTEDPVEDEEDICVATLAGGPMRRLVKSPRVDSLPLWSHDGKWIYFTSGGSGTFDIWRVSSEGGQPQQVTTTGGVGGWESPDGKHLFFFKGLGPPPSFAARTLWRMPVNGGPAVPFLEGIHAAFLTPGIKGMYFLSLAKSPNTGSDILKLYRWNSGDTVILGELSKPVQRAPSALSVSQDGRYVMTVHYENAGSDLMMIEGFR
jgi:Tol biopolymer transport system component/DNA-binding winged helix-turn-helix (wHTH) protein